MADSDKYRRFISKWLNTYYTEIAKDSRRTLWKMFSHSTDAFWILTIPSSRPHTKYRNDNLFVGRYTVNTVSKGINNFLTENNCSNDVSGKWKKKITASITNYISLF